MNREEIQKIIEKLISLLGVGVESVAASEKDGRVTFVVKSADSHLLIGARGTHLSALNHLVKRMAAKSEGEESEKLPNFVIDVNDYYEKLVEELKNKATILAGRARSFKVDVEMEPMSSYERMLVHSLFQDTPDIKTESVGEGNKRRVVIKYVEAFSGEGL